MTNENTTQYEVIAEHIAKAKFTNYRERIWKEERAKDIKQAMDEADEKASDYFTFMEELEHELGRIKENSDTRRREALIVLGSIEKLAKDLGLMDATLDALVAKKFADMKAELKKNIVIEIGRKW